MASNSESKRGPVGWFQGGGGEGGMWTTMIPVTMTGDADDDNDVDDSLF